MRHAPENRAAALVVAVCVASCTLLSSQSARAQSTEPAPGRSRSVYDLRVQQDLVLTAIAGVGLAFPYIFEERLIYPRCPCDEREINGLDRLTLGLHSRGFNLASDVMVVLAVTTPLVLDGLALGIGETYWEDALVYAEALLFSGALVSWTKAVVGRPLPVVYAGLDEKRARSSKGYRSFYSGHASTTATVLVVTAFTVNLRYGDGTVAYWIAALGTGAVGTAKILAGEHFITDVILGGLFGAVVGMSVPMIHRRIGDQARLSLSTTGSGPALSLSGRF